jgi:hypothetical protein
MTTLTATLPATVAAVLSINAPWHPCRPSSVAISGGVATLAADGLAALYWHPRVLALGGAIGAPAPAHDYLTDSAGGILTDSSGAPLWVDAPAVDYLTNQSGGVLVDAAGQPLWT